MPIIGTQVFQTFDNVKPKQPAPVRALVSRAVLVRFICNFYADSSSDAVSASRAGLP